MKAKLLFLFSLVTFSGFSQSPIVSFTPNPESVFSLLTSETPLDQSAQGANAVWNFSGLTEIGMSFYGTAAPTAAELISFPTSTQKLIHFESIDGMPSQTNLFFKSFGNDVSITGISAEGLLINYNTNNAHIGTYPLEYGYNNTDAVAGNYVYGEYDGTFSGNITTTVDAYGTYTTDIPFEGPFSVTRMKTQQTLSMNYSIFTNVGTFTQTIWDYFETGSIDPRLRVTTTAINIPLLSVNETTTGVEMYVATLLGTKSWQQQSVQVVPNPVESILNIKTENQKIKSISIADMTGKIVLTDNSQSQSIDVSQLQKGVYFATIVTDLGSTAKKFIKR